MSLLLISFTNLRHETSLLCLQIEFHLDNTLSTPLEAVGVLRRLESAGLRVFSTEYAYVNGYC